MGKQTHPKTVNVYWSFLAAVRLRITSRGILNHRLSRFGRLCPEAGLRTFLSLTRVAIQQSTRWL